MQCRKRDWHESYFHLSRPVRTANLIRRRTQLTCHITVTTTANRSEIDPYISRQSDTAPVVVPSNHTITTVTDLGSPILTVVSITVVVTLPAVAVLTPFTVLSLAIAAFLSLDVICPFGREPKECSCDHHRNDN